GDLLIPYGDQQELTGVLVAPAGTQSALFRISGSTDAQCSDWCGVSGANFDDVEVEDAVLSDTKPPSSSVTSGPSGTTNSTSATFEFAATEPATFECSFDTAPFAACTSPMPYTGLADGSHTFRVRATDTAGNAEPSPAERTWTIDTRPLAITSFTP